MPDLLPKDDDGNTIFISRKDALSRGLSRYFNGKMCKHGHICERVVIDWGCYICIQNKQRERYRNGQTLLKPNLDGKYEGKNPCKICGENERNKFGACKACIVIQSRNRRCLYSPEKWREYGRNHYQKNPENYKHNAKLRKKSLRKATPDWLSNDQIKSMKEIYKTCGDGCEVDHIVPINNKIVCGLNVPANLQILTRQENRAKWNKFEWDGKEEQNMLGKPYGQLD